MIKALKWTGLLLALLLMLLLATPALISSDWFRGVAEGQLSQLLGRSVIIEGDMDLNLSLTPRFRVENIRLQNAAWAESSHMAYVQALELSIDLLELLSGTIVVDNITVLKPTITLTVSEQGDKNWIFGSDSGSEQAHPSSASGSGSAPAVVRQVTVRGGRLVYQNRASEPEISAEMSDFKLEGSQQQPLRLAADGEIQGIPADVEVTSANLAAFYSGGQRLPINGRVTAGKSLLELQGTFLLPSALTTDPDLNLLLTSPDASVINALLGNSNRALPGYHLQTQITGRDQTWQLDDLRAQIGKSSVTGQLQVSTAAPDRFLQAGLRVDTLDVKQLEEIYSTLTGASVTAENIATPGLSVSENSDSTDQIPAAEQDSNNSDKLKTMLGQLQSWTADIDLQAGEIITPEFSINDFLLRLDLSEDRQLAINPVSLAINDSDAELRVTVDLSRWPLNGSVSGQFDAPDLASLGEVFGLNTPLTGSLSGDIDVLVQDAGVGTVNNVNDNIILPFIGQLTIKPSHIDYKDPANNTLIETTIASEDVGESEQLVRANGSGRYVNEPFELDFNGDSLLTLRHTNKPYNFDLAVTAADTQLELDGWIKNIVTPTGMNVKISVGGPNPARLYPLVGIALPDLPPYQFSGDLAYQQDTRWQIANITGNVGDSDIHGEIEIDLVEEPPVLVAELYSNSLDFDDLAGLVGGTPMTGSGETASAEQKREASEEALSQSVLPNDPVNLQRLRDINATVDFAGKRVQAGKLPLDSLTLQLELQDGHLKIDPLKFSIGRGTVTSSAELKAGAQPIQGILATEIHHVNLNEVMQAFDIGQNSAGIIGGRAKYWMRGDSIAELAASADGGLYMLMTEGHLDSLLIEVAGLDWGEAMAALFVDQRKVDIRCAYLNLHTNNGLTEITNAIFDTDDTVFAAAGSLNFRQETLDIALEPHPKDLSLFTTRTPVHIEGTFKDPAISPGAAALATKTALAALLTAAAGPIGTLLPFIEPGLTNDSNYCNGLIDSVNKFQAAKG